MRRAWTASLMLAMASCGQPGSPIANDNEMPAQEPVAPVEEPAAPSAPDRPTAPADANADDTSAAAAARMVERYGDLLEARRFADARMLWSDDGRASGLTEAEFVTAFEKYAEIEAEVGAPGRSEGAAGSIYIDVPLRLHGTLQSGKPFALIGPVSLRRVNDVPGSTAEQRRWHIARSDLKPRP